MEGGAEVTLDVRDGGYRGEVALMGHGLQMWLQTLWFLARCETRACVILDEPDVYMHADLQRRLIRLVREPFGQVIIATHSTEIISEVEPEQMVSIDRTARRSAYTADMSAAQGVLDGLGSVQNIALVRLGSARRFIVLEGDDMQILKRLQDLLFPHAELPFDALPHDSVAGFGELVHVLRWPGVLENAAGQPIRTYCIVDSDYRCREELRSWRSRAEEYGLDLHVWARKEIENYLLIPEAIARAINQDSKRDEEVDPGAVAAKIEAICKGMRRSVVKAMTTSLNEHFKKWAAGTAYDEAEKRLAVSWASWTGRIGAVPGKDVIRRLSDWSQQSFSVGLSPRRILLHVRPPELDKEVVQVVSAVERGVSLA
jgi:hypothetical protein